MKNINIDDNLKSIMFPHIDRNRFDLIWIDEVDNMDTNNNFYYPKRYIVTIQEKDIPDPKWGPPDRLYAHWFKEKTVNDSPIRFHATTLVIRRRRRKNRDTKKINIKELDGLVVEGTKTAMDILDFLK